MPGWSVQVWAMVNVTRTNPINILQHVTLWPAPLKTVVNNVVTRQKLIKAFVAKAKTRLSKDAVPLRDAHGAIPRMVVHAVKMTKNVLTGECNP